MKVCPHRKVSRVGMDKRKCRECGAMFVHVTAYQAAKNETL